MAKAIFDNLQNKLDYKENISDLCHISGFRTDDVLNLLGIDPSKETSPEYK